MLTELSKLNGIDFSKKYSKFEMPPNYYETDYFDESDELDYQEDYYEIEYPESFDEFEYPENDFQESEEMIDLSDYYDVGDVESIDDENFISTYVNSLIAAVTYSNCLYEETRILAQNSGHIKLTSGLDILHFNMRVDDLKEILRKYDLKVSGKKDELISRIEENLSADQLEKELPEGSARSQYIVTEKGEKYIKKHEVHWYKTWVPPQFTQDEFILLCEDNPNYSAEEILFCLAYQDWIKVDWEDLDEDMCDLLAESIFGYRFMVASDAIEDIDMKIALLKKNLCEKPPIYCITTRENVMFLSSIYRHQNKFELALDIVNDFIDDYGEFVFPGIVDERKRILKNLNKKYSE